jgi:hypothetical protein
MAATLAATSYSQISVTKLIGKNSSGYKLGADLFSFYEFPLNSDGNYKAIRLELLDFAYFPGKDGNIFTASYGIGYLSIKLGYKVIFSETKTGFYLEPSAGYCKNTIAPSGQGDATSSSGVAIALEGGYSIEVGQNGHTLNLGLKFERDMAAPEYTLNSLGLRFSYQFNLFQKKE